MMDVVSRYNQIVVKKDEHYKISFTTPWGTFMYGNMPFGLMNVGATFQRDMHIYFVDEKDKFIVIYLNDMNVYSKYDEQHIKHLKHIFLQCRRYGVKNQISI
jgi:hypothetical protein